MKFQMCNRSFHYPVCSHTLWSTSEYSGRLHCGYRTTSFELQGTRYRAL